MSTGIYALFWETQGLVYVGLSLNIERRYLSHINNLKKATHPNYKLQKAFNVHGIPELVILEKCDAVDLNSKEIAWTKEFNSIEDGLNIVEAGASGYGANSSHSKYSHFTILKVFSMLSRSIQPFSDISLRLGANISLVNGISSGDVHSYLRDVYSERYRSMLANNAIRYKQRAKADCRFRTYSRKTILKVFGLLTTRPFTHKEIASRVGVTFQVVAAIAGGVNHKWLQTEFPDRVPALLKYNEERKLAAINSGTLVSLKSPSGEVYFNVSNLREFCRTTPELSDNPLVASKGLSRLRTKDRLSYRGWTLYKET